jgi:hypothetical protein
MKVQLPLLVSILMMVVDASTVQADHHLKLSGELKSLEFLVGNWALEWEDDNGVKNQITLTTKADAQGHVLRTSGHWKQGDKTPLSWFKLRFDKGHPGGLTEIMVMSNGARYEGPITIHEGTVVTESKGTSQKGEDISFKTDMKMVDENTFSSQHRYSGVNGEAKGEGPKNVFKRVE